MSPDESIVVCLSGRGDKDLLTIAKLDGIVIT
jgi:tryptophan synthase beta chain